MLFHHRYPTSTINVRNACHPFSTKDFYENNYILVHNGVVQNSYTLQRQHEALGIRYVSEQEETGVFNDSEALLWDVARYLEGEQESIKAEGSIAFVVIKRNKKGKPEKLYFGHNSGSPLMMKHTTKELVLASEAEDKQFQATEVNQLYELDYATNEMVKSYLHIPTYWPKNWYSPNTKGYNDDAELYEIENLNDKEDFNAPFKKDDLDAYERLKNSLVDKAGTISGALEEAYIQVGENQIALRHVEELELQGQQTEGEDLWKALLQQENRNLEKVIKYFEDLLMSINSNYEGAV